MPDVQLAENGDLPKYTYHTSGNAEVVQKISIRLNTFRGEWILDDSEGLPFLEWLQTKDPPEADIENRIRAEINAVEGVETIRELDVDIPSADPFVIEVEANITTEHGDTNFDSTITPNA